MVFSLATDYLKEQVQKVTDMMTKEHRKVIKQFINFRNRSEADLKRAEQLRVEVTVLEQRLAMRSPTHEAEFALDERTPLSLYDCLTPKLKEHRRFKITKDS